MFDYIGAVIAFAVGIGVSYGNYRLTLTALKKNNDKNIYATIGIRQAVNLAFLVAVYFIAGVLPWTQTSMLLGAALGVTLPTAAFTRRLLRENNQTDDKGGDEA